MPSYDNTPTLSQTIRAGLGYADAVIGEKVDLIKQEARSNLIYMEAQYEKDQHDFLMKLENSNDYPNYQQEYDNFINSTTKLTQDKNSPYYCKNEYTALRAQEMFASKNVNLQNKVNEVVAKKTMQDVISKDTRTIELNRQNKDAQDAIDANSALYGYWYSKGWITPDEYKGYLENELYVIKNNKIKEYYDANYQKYIDAGLTDEEMYTKIISDHPELNQLSTSYITAEYADEDQWTNAGSGQTQQAKKYPTAKEVESKIENAKQEIQDAKDQLETNRLAKEEYKKRGETFSSDNDKKLKELIKNKENELKELDKLYNSNDFWNNQDIGTGKSDNEEISSGRTRPLLIANDEKKNAAIKKSICQEYNAAIASMQEKNYTKLSESYTQMERIQDPLQRYNYCKAALSVIDNQMKGNRLDEAKRVSYTKLFLSEMDDIDRLLKNGGSGSSSNLDKYSEVINNDEKTFLALVENGTFNYMDAAEAYQNHLIEVWNETDGYWKETKNMTKEEAENYFQKKYGKAGIDEILNNEILNKALNRVEYAGLKKKWTNITNDISNDLKKPEKDRKFSANAMNIAGAFVIKMVAENGVGVMSPEAIEEQEQFLNNMYLDQLEKNFKGANISSDAGIIKGINILNSNDVVMKDVQGNEVWASDAAKQKVEEIAAQQQEVIAKSIGIDMKDLQPHGYMKTKYDVKPIPIFEYRGDLYHLELTPDEKSYDVVDQDGNRYQSLTVKEQRYSDKQQKKANRQVIKEANTAASEHAIERGEELDKKTKSYFTPNQQKRLR